MRKYSNNGRTPNTISKELLLDRTIQHQDGCWEWVGYKTNQGYGRVMAQRRSYLVHRLAMHLWKDFDLNSALLICHHCDNPPCINPEHLFVGTVYDNVQDMKRKGRSPKKQIGEASPIAKLTEANVKRIFKLLAEGKLNQRQIARKFKISPGYLSQIKSGFYWKHIQDELKDGDI
jgi:hypothetical protein